MDSGPVGGSPRGPTALTATALKPRWWIYTAVLIRLGDGSRVYAVVVAAGSLRAPCAVVYHATLGSGTSGWARPRFYGTSRLPSWMAAVSLAGR